MGLRWTSRHFISLHNVVDVALTDRREATLSSSSREESFECRDRLGSDRSAASKSEATSTRFSVNVTYDDAGGVRRSLILGMAEQDATIWEGLLRSRVQLLRHVASPAHWRWALSCMAAAVGKPGKPAPVSMSNSALPSLLLCANTRPHQISEWVKELVHVSGQRLTSQQIMNLLLRLSVATPRMEALFNRYADGQMSVNEWLTFIQTEQIAQQRASFGSRSQSHQLTRMKSEEMVEGTERFKTA
eukprot:4237892-Prymnesium_polylepis.1